MKNNNAKNTHYASTVIEDNDRRILKMIKNTKDGSWTVFFSINKKRKQKKFATKNSAQEFIDQFESFIKGKRKTVVGSGPDKGVEVELASITFECIEHECDRGDIAESSYYAYWTSMMCNFPEHIKTMVISKIDDDKIKEIREFCKSDRRTGGESNGTRFQRAMLILKKINEYAIEKGYRHISSVNLKKIKTPIRPRNNRQTYNLADYEKTLDFFDDTNRIIEERISAALLAINMQLGLRVGELVALKVSDINFDQMEVRVERTQTKDRQGRCITGDTTKQKKIHYAKMTDRTAELFKFIVDFRRSPRWAATPKNKHSGSDHPWTVRYSRGTRGYNLRYFKTEKEAQDWRLSVLEFRSDIEDFFPVFNRVFLLPGGRNQTSTKKHISSTTLGRRWQGKRKNKHSKASDGICKKIGIPYLSSHQAGRKTMATILARGLGEQGVNPMDIARTVQEAIGHANVNTTLTHYILPTGAGRDKTDSVFDVGSKKKSHEKKMDISELLSGMTDGQKEELSELLEALKKDPA